jgi:DegV family protein with EDD domain
LIRIVTDSSCDLPPEVVEEYGITVVPMYINVGSKSFLDGVEMTRPEFYEALPDFEVHPTTSVPGPQALTSVYEGLASAGAQEIVSIHIASSLSGMVNSARVAAGEFRLAAVQVVDSGNLTLGLGLQVLAAARAAQEGRSLAEVVALVEDQSARTHSFAAIYTLEYLRRSGRLSRLQAGLASALRIKPLLRIHQGQLEMERVRTWQGLLRRLLEQLEGLGSLEDVALVHADAPERLEELRRRVSPLFPTDRAPLVAEVTPTIGAHVGPGAVGLIAVVAAP